MDNSVSIMILNYNGRTIFGEASFSRFLSSVLKTKYGNFEVIFFDNGSTDDSVGFVRSKFHDCQRLRIVVNRENLGYSAGNNRALDSANGEYIVLLNNDVEVDPDWLKELVAVTQHDSSIGIAQSKVLHLDGVHIQSAGNLLDPSMMTYAIGEGEIDRGQYNRISEITYGNGASIIVRRSLVEKLGLFDPNYFFYHDDCDLGWRVRLAGFRVVLAPLSIVYHKGRVTSSATFRGNRYWLLNSCSRVGLFIKNLELRNLLKLTPYLVLSLGLDFLGLALDGEGTTFKDFAVWIVMNFRRNWKNRIIVQNQIRRVGDNEILKYFLDSSILLLRIMRYPSRLVGGKIFKEYATLANRICADYYSRNTLG